MIDDEIKIAIVDDEPDTRLSLTAVFDEVGFQPQSFGCGASFLDRDDAGSFSCILLDLRMPNLDGLQVFRELKRKGLAERVLFLSGHGDIKTAVMAVREGAGGFLEKTATPDDVVGTVREIVESQIEVRIETLDRNRALQKWQNLTRRQKDVLLGVMKGDPNKLVAHSLGLSIRTVEFHRREGFKRLGVRSTSQLVRLAIFAGILEGK